MGAKKHDWAALKHEYLTGEEHSVQEFIRQKLGIANMGGSHRQEVKGWSKEWKTMRRDAAKKRAQEILDSRAEDLAVGLDNIRKYFIEVVEDEVRRKQLSAAQAVEVWKILRIENGQPINISKNMIGPTGDPNDSINKLLDV